MAILAMAFFLEGALRSPAGENGYPPTVTFRLPSLSKLSPIFTIVVFGFAIYAIYLELHKYSFGQIRDAVLAIPGWHVAIAAGLVIPGLIALAGYDLVAARHCRIGIGWWRPLATGLLGYSITNTTGHGVLVGAMLRLRVYPRWGVSGRDVGMIVGFGVLTYYMGLSFVSSGALLLEGAELTRLLSKLPKVGPVFAHEWFRYVIPSALLGAIAFWFVLTMVRRRPFMFRGHEVRLPGPGIGLLQLTASVADLAIASTVLYVLLPPHHDLGWLAFVGIFSVVQFVALMSAVPGGIGVFTAIMLVVLAPRFPSEADLVASLITFRVLYYLVPFLIGGLVFLVLTFTRRTKVGSEDPESDGKSPCRVHTGT